EDSDIGILLLSTLLFSLSKSEYMSATCFLISTRACGGGSPRVRSAKKSTCACGASYRHARPHRARAERVSRVCAPRKRVRPRAGRVTGARTRIAHVLRRFPACALHKKEYVRVWGELSARAPPSCTCRASSPHACGVSFIKKG